MAMKVYLAYCIDVFDLVCVLKVDVVVITSGRDPRQRRSFLASSSARALVCIPIFAVHGWHQA